MTGFDSKQRMTANKLQEPVQEPVASVHIKDGCLVGSHRNGSKLFPDGQYGLWPITVSPLPMQPAQEPVAYVTGTSFGRFIVEPLNPAMVLPIGMALYSSPQENT